MFVNSISIQNAVIQSFTFLFSLICLGIIFILFFFDVVKIVIIHKKIVTFGYRQVM